LNGLIPQHGAGFCGCHLEPKIPVAHYARLIDCMTMRTGMTAHPAQPALLFVMRGVVFCAFGAQIDEESWPYSGRNICRRAVPPSFGIQALAVLAGGFRDRLFPAQAPKSDTFFDDRMR
jgi:hypothetical protein